MKHLITLRGGVRASRRTALFCAWWIVMTASDASAQGAPVHLTVESVSSPLALDTAVPRFSWQMSDDRRGARQTAWRVRVTSNQTVLWDSGRVESDQSVLVEYGGAPLAPLTRTSWQVRIWDGEGEASPWSESASFETGLLDAADWEAKWIGASDNPPVETPELERWIEATAVTANHLWVQQEKPADEAAGREVARKLLRELRPAPMFRKSFQLERPVRQARLYLCGLGYHETWINGEPASDRCLDPRVAEHDRRGLYVALDVTPRLKQGDNTLGVVLGDGWYAQSISYSAPGSPYAYGDPGLICRLEIEHEDGTRTRLVSDETWQWKPSAILKNAIYAGEFHDARREQADWSSPGVDGADWKAVQVREPLVPALSPMMMPPVRRIETRAAAITEPQPGVWVFDFGRIFAGRGRLHLTETQAGDLVTMRWGGVLNDDGTVNSYNSGTDTTGYEQLDGYVCQGAPTETWEPRFTYHGARYAEVRGLRHAPDKDTLTAVLLRSDLPADGEFECSHPLLNQIHEIMGWTVANNIMGTVNAMSTRERDPWAVNALLNGQNLSYRRDMRQAWSETLRDWRDTTHPDGVPWDITPGKRRFNTRDFTLAAAVKLPWDLHTFYGDRRALEESYELMRRSVAHFEKWAEKPGSTFVKGLGDWLDPNPPFVKVTKPAENTYGGQAASKFTPNRLTATALRYHATDLLAKTAVLLGKNEDAARYRKSAGEIRHAFNQRYYRPDPQSYGSQCADSYAVLYGLAPESHHERVAQSLANNVMGPLQGHFSTGFFGTPTTLRVLSRFGHDEAAFTAMTQTSYPSYGYMIEKLGAQEIWEGWEDKIDPEHGPRHGRLQTEHSGAGEWFFHDVLGIQPDPAAPGFKHFFLRPTLYDQLEFARGRYRSSHGDIVSDWRNEGGDFHWEIVIPPNTEATVHLPRWPGGRVSESGQPIESVKEIRVLSETARHLELRVPAGRYLFTSTRKKP